jgi:DNA (cytosine-5)-methyltransferase 1
MRNKRTVEEKYPIPQFNLQRLLDYLQQLVDEAEGGVIQLVIDLFCGAGGTSEGFEQAVISGKKCSAIIVGVNHDRVAIHSQARNHPLAMYLTEDIRLANLIPVKQLLGILRERFPNCPIILWASLECTNHSVAKGGQSRDEDSRTLAWDLMRYIKELNVDGIWIENVKEFAEWGPLVQKEVWKGKTGKKMKQDYCPSKNGEQEFYWKKINSGQRGYCEMEIVRDKKSKRIIDYRPKWAPDRRFKGTFFEMWTQEVKDVGYYLEHRVLNAADYACPTNRHRLFLLFMKHGWPISWPEATHSRDGEHSLFGKQKHIPVKTCLDFSVEGETIFGNGTMDYKGKTPERVLAGLIKFIAGGKLAYEKVRKGYKPMKAVRKDFLDVIYGNGYASQVEDPAPTVRTKDGLALVQPQFLLHQQGKSNANSIDQPSPTIMTNNKLSLVTPVYWIFKDQKTGKIPTAKKSIEASNLKQQHYILNPSWFGHASSTEEPSVTIVARQDKAPIYLITVNGGYESLAIPVFKQDTPTVVAIKEFMVLYGIVDIKKRMLMIPELLKIQSFPENYYLGGTQTDQKKFIGNAVPPLLAKALAENMYVTLRNFILNNIPQYKAA